MMKRRDRHVELLCVSCCAKPAKTIVGPLDTKCIPWHGEFDLNDNPLTDDGHELMPGVRLCGHSDCVNREHLER